jgi:plastocyanin
VLKDANYCGDTKPNERLILSAANGVQNTVVWLEDIKAGDPLTPGDVTIDQNKCQYSPHVSVVPVGSNLVLTNSDPILHNVHTYMDASAVFNQAQPSKGQSNKFPMTKPGVLAVRCDVHLHMNAYSIVAPTPYFAITDADGKYTLKDVPAGTYTVHAWHEGWTTTVSPDKTKIDFSDPVEGSHPAAAVTAGQPTTVDFSITNTPAPAIN